MTNTSNHVQKTDAQNTELPVHDFSIIQQNNKKYNILKTFNVKYTSELVRACLHLKAANS